MKLKLLSAVLLSTALLAACGGEESADAEACEHLKEGPASTVTAAATASGAPAVNNDHRRYDITLADINGGKGGSVSFAVAEAATYVLFTTVDAGLGVKNANGQDVTVSQRTTSSTECTEVKGRYTVPLTVGTHTLSFGPVSATTLSLVIEEEAHGDDHEH